MTIKRSDQIPGRDAFLSEAKRLSEGVAMRHPPGGKNGCLRKCLTALYKSMAPKIDGTHPLDGKEDGLK